MKNKLILIGVILCTLLVAAACAKTKALTCDGCGTEVRVEESSNMEEDWIIYCEECNNTFFANDPVFQKQ